MIKNKYIMWVIIPLILSGCLPEPLEIENIPEAEVKIVVSSVYIPDQSFAIILTRSTNALEEIINSEGEVANDLLVENARVTIASQNKTVLLDNLLFGIYGTNSLDQQIGETFHLEVYDSLTGLWATASTKLLEPVQLDSLDVSIEAIGTDTLPRIHYEFTDFPDNNWYMINVQHFQYNDDPLSALLNRRIYSYLLTDENSDQNKIISGDFYALVGFNMSLNDTLLISLSNISYEYYTFLEQRNNSNYAIDLVSEPFNLPSNVENGYGYFNLHIPDYHIELID